MAHKHRCNKVSAMLMTRSGQHIPKPDVPPIGKDGIAAQSAKRSIEITSRFILLPWLQAGIVGAALPSAPKPAATSSETIDRATCLYETEWQVTDLATGVGRNLAQAAPERINLAACQHRNIPTQFVWASADRACQVTASLAQLVMMPVQPHVSKSGIIIAAAARLCVAA